jgi:hypothetical protein
VAGENDTPREKGSPLKTTEAEPGPEDPITLHDASMGGICMLRRKKSMPGRNDLDPDPAGDRRSGTRIAFPKSRG